MSIIGRSDVSRAAALIGACLCFTALRPEPAPTSTGAFHVHLASTLAAPDGGRLIVMLTQKKLGKGGHVTPDILAPADVYITSVDVARADAGATIDLPFDRPGFPARVRDAIAGRYTISAYFDVHRHFAYGGPEPGDLTGPTVRAIVAPGRDIDITLDATIPERKPREVSGVDTVVVHSASLSAFAGHDVQMRALVVSPPPRAAGKTYPTVFEVGGFGVTSAWNVGKAASLARSMAWGRLPACYYVLLDPTVPTGHDAFADSANNGPYGTALTTELIPAIEARYPAMAANVHGRFLTGHSSGGWTTLWLQVTYPDIFGGTWSTSPDPVDFHNFTGPDLLTDHNMYRRADGTPYNLVRSHGEHIMTLEQYVQQEDIEGATGGQFRSFDAVFSPRGADGTPLPLFDHVTGAIDPAVAQAWERYDIATIVKNTWPTLGPKLAGKIHIIVGTDDTFHLNESVERFADELRALGSDADVRFLVGRDHFNLYENGLATSIANEMNAAYSSATAARPHELRASGAPAELGPGT